MSHLNYLHTAGISSGSEVDYKELLLGKLHSHEWSGNWEVLPEPSSHVGRLTLSMANIILGVKVKALNFNVTADQVGESMMLPGIDTRFLAWGGRGDNIICLSVRRVLDM